MGSSPTRSAITIWDLGFGIWEFGLPRYSETRSQIRNPKSQIPNRHGGVAQRKSKGLINLRTEVRIFPPQHRIWDFGLRIADFAACVIRRKSQNRNPKLHWVNAERTTSTYAPRGEGNSGDPKLFMRKMSFQILSPDLNQIPTRYRRWY